MRHVKIGTALALQSLFLGPRCRFFRSWQKFWENKEKSGTTVMTKDVWELFYDLNKQTQGDFANFEDDFTWPPVYDEFFAFMEAQTP